MEDGGPPPGEEEEEEYVDALGVITALERTCELEARLRQAIQDTHPLTTTLDWDFNAADREREGLLAISEQLEYLEDKLREYRFLEPAELDNKAVLLGQLDSVRRELVEVAGRWAPHIMFGKELVREVLAFAQVSEEEGAPEDEEEPSGGSGSADSSGLPDGVGPAREPSDVELLQAARRLRHQGSGGSGSMGGFASEFEPEEEVAPRPRAAAVPGLLRRSTPELYESQGLGGEQGALIPAVRRSTSAGLARPPRYPAGASKEQQAQLGGKQRLALPATSPKHQQAAAQLGTAASPPSLPSLHEQHQLAAQQTSPPSRSAFLQHQQEQSTLAHQRGYVQPSQVPRSGWEDGRERQLEAAAVPGATSPGAAATVSALRTATAAARGASGRRQLDVDAAAAAGRGAPGPRGGLGSGGAGADTYSFGPREAQAAGVASYPPSSYAPSESAPSNRQSPYSARSGAPLGGAPTGGAAARPSSSQLSKLNRAQQGTGYADSASRYTAYSKLRDEDIYGALDDGPGGRPTSLRPASIINPSPRQYGGYVRIRDRLSQAETTAKTPEVQEQRREPMPPRIYGEPDSEEIQPASYAASPAPSRRSGRSGIIVDDPPALQPSPPRSERLALAYSSGGAGVAGRPAFSEARGGSSRDSPREGRGGGLSRLLGGAARLLLTGAAAAAVAVAAHKAGPVVLQKGQQAAARLAEEQHRLAERWQERQQRKREQAAAQAQRKREQAVAAAAQQQRQPRAAAGSKGMADLPPRPGSGLRGLADAPPPHLRAGAGRPADLPPHPKKGDTPPWERTQAATAAKAAAAKAAAAKQQPQQPQRPQAPQGRPARGSAGCADPLPLHLAAAARNGGVPGRVPPVAQVHPPPHGMLFPAMPPPDVSASMG